MAGICPESAALGRANTSPPASPVFVQEGFLTSGTGLPVTGAWHSAPTAAMTSRPLYTPAIALASAARTRPSPQVSRCDIPVGTPCAAITPSRLGPTAAVPFAHATAPPAIPTTAVSRTCTRPPAPSRGRPASADCTSTAILHKVVFLSIHQRKILPPVKEKYFSGPFLGGDAAVVFRPLLLFSITVLLPPRTPVKPLLSRTAAWLPPPVARLLPSVFLVAKFCGTGDGTPLPSALLVPRVLLLRMPDLPFFLPLAPFLPLLM